MNKLFIILVFLLALINHSEGHQPNIVVIISDDLNTRIGPYMEIDEHTPNLDRLAREGVRFPECIVNIPYVVHPEHLL